MQHKFKTENGEYLIVAVPEGDAFDGLKKICCSEVLPNGKYEIVGLWPGLSEFQATRILGIVEPSNYKDYKHEGLYYYSALESFDSLMESERLYTDNPLGDEPILHYSMEDNYDHHQWQLAEERTSKQWIILKLK